MIGLPQYEGELSTLCHKYAKLSPFVAKEMGDLLSRLFAAFARISRKCHSQGLNCKLPAGQAKSMRNRYEP